MDRRTLLGALAGTPLLSGCRNEPEPEPASSASARVVDAVKSMEPLAAQWQTLDPFLFCVHHDDAYPAANPDLGPAASLAGRELGSDFSHEDGWSMYHGQTVPGFPEHPHRGFETVTVVRRGLVDHSDSLGATARYGGGDVQWLTAGKGIVHAEMFPLLDHGGPNPLELFQIWLNLPASDKFAEPHFSMFWRSGIPKRQDRDAAGKAREVTVVAGRFAELSPPAPPPKSWAARPESDVAIWTIKLEAGAELVLPSAASGSNRMLYFFRGDTLRISAHQARVGHAIELEAGSSVRLLNGAQESELLLLQGRPIGEPIVKYGPFVMTSQTEIRQAYSDYQSTHFGGWPWPNSAPVNGTDAVRFARHADGRIERAT